ncbi:MAG: acyl carrier protein [Candidatus Wallbacteria bacterium]|nr:acyl carrier protein [Candidatus Wallbacteria bacterium]
MQDSEIMEKVKDCLVTALGVDRKKIELDSSLVNDLGAESLDLLDLVFRLEQTFKIRLSRGEMENKARKTLTDEEFEQDGILSAAALEKLREQMPEVAADKFKPGMRASDIPTLFTPRTFLRIVAEKLESEDKAS